MRQSDQTLTAEDNIIPPEYRLSSYDYSFDESAVAPFPAERRDMAKLLVSRSNESEGEIIYFKEIVDFLGKGDLLVMNISQPDKVRLRLKRSTGGSVEVLVMPSTAEEYEGGTVVEAMFRGGSKLKDGEILNGEGFSVKVFGAVKEGFGRIILNTTPSGLSVFLERFGEVPLPPYIIKRRLRAGIKYDFDAERYRTVYGSEGGGIAAPTAGFHFTPELLTDLRDRGVDIAFLRLDVGSDTFLPVRHEDIRLHKVRSERCVVGDGVVEAVKKAKSRGGRVVAVGTTTTRALETAALGGNMEAFDGYTDLTILPGHKFRVVDAMITNFHMPKSSLLIMIAAFAGRERILSLYRQAASARMRFYSYGDAMLLFR